MTATPSGAEDLSGAGAEAAEDGMDEDKGEMEVAAGEEGKVEGTVVPTNPRKRRRVAADETGDKKRKYRIDIPVINLDVDEGVEELKREAQGEEEKDEALAVEEAVKALFGGERPCKEQAPSCWGR